MAYRLEWYLQDRILLTTYEGTLTLENLREVNQATKDLIETSPYAPVHNIIDSRNLDHFPKSLNEMSQVADVLKNAKAGWFIVINHNPVQNFIVTILANTFKTTIKSARSMDEALDILYRMDLSLEK